MDDPADNQDRAMKLPRMVNRRGMIATVVILAIDFMPATRSAGADEPFFPDLVFDTNRKINDFVVKWYSKHLKAMKEPSLWQLSKKDRSATVYRFLWLPTFHRPVSVRLVRSSEGTILHAVLIDGRGGYEPGKIIISKTAKISGKQWENFQRCLDKVQFWEMPSKDPEDGGLDGDHLILEAVRAGKHHIVDRWSPDAGGDYTKLCRYMLVLSGLDVMKTWEEYRE
jgi:hypothetical protein